MRPRRSAYLADLVHQHRSQLGGVVSNLRARDRAMSAQLESRLHALAENPGLAQVEDVLRHALYDRLPIAVRPLLRRLRSWMQPRLGAVRPRKPARFTVPEKYRHVPPGPSTHLADLVGGHREDLRALVSALPAAEQPISQQFEDDLAALADDARLTRVETALRHSRVARRLPAGARRFLARVRSWTRPRIGILRHHDPKPFLLPEKYLWTTPPLPAPTISIVTPSFEQGAYLERTIRSVLNQNYRALEYVVQDGASSDETLEILRRLDPLLDGWRSEPDEGQADAINRGFARTSGEIMAWLNSDDLLLPGTLAYVARYFAAHPGVDVVYGNRVMIDEHDRQIGVWILPAHDDGALMLADFVPQETLFWRRRIWDRIGGRVDSDFKFALDWDLLLRFRAAGATIVRLPRFLGAFRVHAQQKTTVDNVVGLEECDALRSRVHGRVLPIDEVGRRLRPYLMRQMAVHALQTSAVLLTSLRMIEVERWLNASAKRTKPRLTDVDAGTAVLSSPLVSLDASARPASGQADELQAGGDGAQVRGREPAKVRPVELDSAAARRSR